MSLKLTLLPVELSDETMDLANTLIAVYKDPEVEDSAKPCPDSWATETLT